MAHNGVKLFPYFPYNYRNTAFSQSKLIYWHLFSNSPKFDDHTFELLHICP